MDIQEAASNLLEFIAAPSGSVSVWPWTDQDGVVLIVRVAPGAKHLTSNIPEIYQDYRVMLVDMDIAKAL